MKSFLALLLFVSFIQLAFSSEESAARDLINKVISSKPRMAYNPISSDPAELIKADAHNVEFRLQSIILNSKNEELKACYALYIVNGYIEMIERMIKFKEPTSMMLPEALQGPLKQREIIVKYLRSISKKQTEQDAAANP